MSVKCLLLLCARELGSAKLVGILEMMGTQNFPLQRSTMPAAEQEHRNSGKGPPEPSDSPGQCRVMRWHRSQLPLASQTK